MCSDTQNIEHTDVDATVCYSRWNEKEPKQNFQEKYGEKNLGRMTIFKMDQSYLFTSSRFHQKRCTELPALFPQKTLIGPVYSDRLEKIQMNMNP